jgi:hypothetical protein
MTQTIDQGRPDGHPGYCACPECFQWYQQRNPIASPTSSELVLTPAEQTADYARRIHWWVRLFGIIWIVIPAIAAVALVAFLLGAMANGTTS